MVYIAGVDVGNNTTEVAVAEVRPEGRGQFPFQRHCVRTVGIKGTVQNSMGVIDGLDTALKPLALKRSDLSLILLNEATPVIGDVAMETITETVITESAMIGHNPATPGGQGLGVGTTDLPGIRLKSTASMDQWIVVVPGNAGFSGSGRQINQIHGSGASRSSEPSCKMTTAFYCTIAC